MITEKYGVRHLKIVNKGVWKWLLYCSLDPTRYKKDTKNTFILSHHYFTRVVLIEIQSFTESWSRQQRQKLRTPISTNTIQENTCIM